MNQKSDIHILILDDDALIAHDIAALLEDDGYSIPSPCHDFEDVMDSMNKNTIDLAILDINLEGEYTGIDVADYIRKNYKIPYVFLTSYSDEKTFGSALEMGPHGYLVKPFQKATLLTTIQLALGNHARLKNKVQLNFHQENLSDREKGICQKLTDGKSYIEIAELEFISINTVRYHIKNLYVKYDVNSRSELVSKLIS